MDKFTHGVIAIIEMGNSLSGLAITPNSLLAYVADNNNATFLKKDSITGLDFFYNTVQHLPMTDL